MRGMAESPIEGISLKDSRHVSMKKQTVRKGGGRRNDGLEEGHGVRSPIIQRQRVESLMKFHRTVGQHYSNASE